MKTHIVDELKSAGLSGVEAQHQFNMVAEAMARVVERGDRVRLPGIGTLVRKPRAQTTVRNPRSGEKMTIGGYDVVALRNAKRF